MALSTRSRRLGGLLVFFVALVVRLAFWQATADRHWPGSAVYAGDATTWVAHAARIADAESSAGTSAAHRPFELDLPLRPPGNAWLLALLAGGDVERAKAVWCLLGAFACLLVYHATCRAFGFGVALATGLLCAASTGLLSLSTSLNNETPYLALVLATVVLWRPLRDRPSRLHAVVWGIFHAAATLVRAEHLLFALLASGALAVEWRRLGVVRAGEQKAVPARRRRTAGGATVAGLLATAAAAYLVVLVPWQLSSWRAIERINTVAPDTPGERFQRQIEERLAAVPWAPAAAGERQRWPAFARRTAANFVTATVLWRGGRHVGIADLRILDDAFGVRPEPLGRGPFVALYGGLAFWLANNPAADGGFSRGPLAAPPPLAGGAAAYPPALIAGLPPDDLALTYPPHLAAVNNGWRRGLEWIASRPAAWTRLMVTKAARFTAGATLGVTGHGLPLGPSGVRRPVDLVVPKGGLAVGLWRLAVVLTALAGIALARPRRELVPWLLFAGVQLAVAVAFFGYARLGATVAPCVALFVVLAVRRLLPEVPARRALALAAAAGLLLVAVESGRAIGRPVLLLDDRAVGPVPPRAADEHVERRLRVER